MGSVVVTRQQNAAVSFDANTMVLNKKRLRIGVHIAHGFETQRYARNFPSARFARFRRTSTSGGTRHIIGNRHRTGIWIWNQALAPNVRDEYTKARKQHIGDGRLSDAEPAQGRPTQPEGSSVQPAENADQGAVRGVSLHPLFQLVSGTATLSGSETSITTGRYISRGQTPHDDTAVEIASRTNTDARSTTWTVLLALPTLADSPLLASDIRFETRDRDRASQPQSRRRRPAQTRAVPHARPVIAETSVYRSRLRAGFGTALTVVLVVISISLVAASLVLMTWSLLEGPNSEPLGRVNLDAVYISATNR